MVLRIPEKKTLLLFPCVVLLLTSCTRKTIDFGQDLGNTYTNLVLIDTVGVSLSTVVNDSFTTGNATSFLVGKYKDPYLGLISAKPFFQLNVPAALPTLSPTAQFDSLGLIIHFNKYYYGDTTRPQTIQVNELAQTIYYGYNDQMYNTNDFAVKTPPLGSVNMTISPANADSVIIRLSDAKGMDLFARLQDQSTEMSNVNDFLNYFKGISLTTRDNDTTAIYGLKGDAGSIIMRLYYHTSTPFPTSAYVDFPSQVNSYAFQQLKANRSGTTLPTTPGYNGMSEISASQTNDLGFLQAGTGVHLKITFPSLRSILSTDKIIQLLKAELIIRPAYRSFDRYRYPLPDPIFLQQTDASNIAGATVSDSTGSEMQNVSPVIDDLYGENNYYRFNITPYISQMLATAGSSDKGFFVMNNESTSAMNVTRLIVNNSLHGTQSTRLLLSVLVINKQ